jgi:transcriptional regulator with XRE-family HTH domain
MTRLGSVAGLGRARGLSRISSSRRRLGGSWTVAVAKALRENSDVGCDRPFAPSVARNFNGRACLWNGAPDATNVEVPLNALAEIAGLHRTYVGSIERKERNVSLDNVEKLAKALGIDVCDVLASPQSTLLVRP